MNRQSLVPLVLMAIPSLIIGTLAFRTNEAEHAVLQAEYAEAATVRLRLVSTVVQSAIEQLATGAVVRVASTLSAGTDPISALRSLILAREMEFVLVEESNRRRFPSEDNPEPLLEQRKLHALSGVLAGLRAEMARQDEEQGWTWILEENGRALLHCRRQPPERFLCVVLAAAQVEQAVRAALDANPGQSDFWALSVADAAGTPVWPQTNTDTDTETKTAGEPAIAAVRLAAPLRAWQAEARRRPGVGVVRWPMLMAIIAPLLAGWVSLAWVFHRTQRTQWEENRRRTEIATQLSHDLRTPLANLRLYATLIARKADEPAATQRYCRIVEEEIARLSLLADNAVAIAKGEAMEMADHGTAFPAEMVSTILTRLRPLLDAAGCTATLRVEAAEAIVFNRSAYDRIVTNLLDNARKYAPGSAIDIATWVEGDRLTVSVRDHGPGLPPASAERPSGGLGFGLGLATIRRLARANGGDARIENAEPGACATAWLSCAPASSPDGEAPPCTS